MDSIALYAKYPNWTILGDVYIADISKDLTSTANSGYSKNLEMVVHSAVQKKTIPGFNLREGSKIAIVNVSITNNNPADITIYRENVFIMNERGSTLEHGGDRVTNEIARDYLRFPFIIKPGETITGPVIYVVSSGTRVNTLVVMDENYVINSVADLNTIYQYE